MEICVIFDESWEILDQAVRDLNSTEIVLCLIWVNSDREANPCEWIELNRRGPRIRVTQLKWALITHLRGEALF